MLDSDLPLTTYRIIGVTTGLTRANGVPLGKLVLLPAEVYDHGTLEVLDARKPVPRQPSQKEVLEIILEF